jgi:hypothetical protein
LLCTVIGLHTAANAADPAAPTFAINIAAEAPDVETGDPIVITIITTNISKEEIQLDAVKNPHAAEFDTVINVWNSLGQKAIKTKYGKHITGEESLDWNEMPAVWSNLGIVLPPEKQQIETAEVSKLYDMTIPGVYSVQVERGSRRWPQTFGQSNVINVTVAK